MTKGSEDNPGIRDEYDFTAAQRGKYAERFAEGARRTVRNNSQWGDKT